MDVWISLLALRPEPCTPHRAPRTAHRAPRTAHRAPRTPSFKSHIKHFYLYLYHKREHAATS